MAAWAPPAAQPLLLNDGELAECPLCLDLVPPADIQVRHMNTAYHRDEDNYLESCRACWEYSEMLWAEQWADYYAGRL